MLQYLLGLHEDCIHFSKYENCVYCYELCIGKMNFAFLFFHMGQCKILICGLKKLKSSECT